MSDTYKGASLQHWLWRCWMNQQIIYIKRLMKFMDEITYGPCSSGVRG